jgi:hypothetical protein
VPDPGIYSQFLGWMEANRVGDLASVAGVAISLIGFTVTVIGVARSKNAAQKAEQAANSARETVRLMDTVVDFTAAVTALDEIKRLHRTSNWVLLLDRYSTIRRLLVIARTNNSRLTSSQQEAIQSALANLIVLENTLERALANGATPNTAKLNASISVNIDNLLAALTEIKMSKVGDG